MLECCISTGEIGRYTNERSNLTLNVRYQPTKVVGDYTTTHKVEITYGLAFNKRAACNDLLNGHTIYLKTKSSSKMAQYISMSSLQGGLTDSRNSKLNVILRIK